MCVAICCSFHTPATTARYSPTFSGTQPMTAAPEWPLCLCRTSEICPITENKVSKTKNSTFNSLHLEVLDVCKISCIQHSINWMLPVLAFIILFPLCLQLLESLLLFQVPKILFLPFPLTTLIFSSSLLHVNYSQSHLFYPNKSSLNVVLIFVVSQPLCSARDTV